MPVPSGDPEVVALYSRLLNEIGKSHRAAAVVICAQVDDALKGALLTKFRSLDAADRKNLFHKVESPLASTFARIELAYAMDIIASGPRADLQIVREIRNKFAHDISVESFEHPAITKLCAKLTFPEWHASRRPSRNLGEPFDRFLLSGSAIRYSLQKLTLPGADSPYFGDEAELRYAAR